jgi:hypothetical protein
MVPEFPTPSFYVYAVSVVNHDDKVRNGNGREDDGMFTVAKIDGRCRHLTDRV